MEEDIREHAQSAVARSVIVLVAEDRGVDLGLGRILQSLDLFFDFRRDLRTRGLNVFLDSVDDANASAIFPVRFLFWHSVPRTCLTRFATVCSLASAYLLGRKKRSRIIELCGLAFGPGIELGDVDDDLPVRS